MTVRKRAWTNRDGSQSETWVVAYTDQAGKRRLKSFDKKHEANSYQVGLGGELRSGVHVPDIEPGDLAGLEPQPPGLGDGDALANARPWTSIGNNSNCIRSRLSAR
jgi:hypothetical protein